MKLFKSLAGFVLLLILAVFLLSNRETVGVTYWPFGLVLGLPLGGIALGALILGFVFGMLFHLPRRMAAASRSRRLEKRVQELEARLSAPPAV